MRVDLGPIARIPVGEGRVVDIGRRRLAVFRARDGRVHVTQAACPHRGGPLADGLLGGDVVVCPLHGRRFSLVTGACLVGDCAPLEVFAVHIDARGHCWVEPELAEEVTA